ncbi:MAG: hypothetical protein O6939_01750, partial [Bacteroidetes bacterium]|nr:hypothetical protein [Bacteroidota bacterium]
MKLYLILFLSFMIVINFGYTQPVNDNLSNSIDITSLINSCSADADYTNINSTSDQDNGSCWDTIGGSNVWFNFTAPASGEIK